MDTLYDPYSHFCCVLAHLSHGFSVNAVGVHDLNCTPSLVSLQWSGLSDQQMFLTTENHLQCQKWSPHNSRRVISTLICAKKEINGPACAKQVLSTTSQDSCHLLAQNLPSKGIALTDNMQPKLHDEYTHHQLANRPTKQLFNKFIRGLVTITVGLCQGNAYHTELADANLCMAVNDSHHF